LGAARALQSQAVMLIARVVIAAVAALAITLTGPRQSEACSPPPPVQLEETHVDGIPVAGVVPILVWGNPGQVDQVAVAVFDGEVEVAGTFELFSDRLVWRSEEPLAPETGYRMVITDFYLGDGLEVTFETAAADAPLPPAPPLAAELELRELERAASEICCDEAIGSCESSAYWYCWAQSYEYPAALYLTFDIEDDVRRYWSYDLSGQAAAVVNDVGLANGAGAIFEGAPRDEYCVTVTATSLLDATAIEREHCAGAAELVPTQRSEPEALEPELCEGPLVDGDTGEEIDDDVVDHLTEGDGGCSTGGGGGLWLALAALAPLRRRRRRS
jgi:MYXO-CTERM domain-containing protein